MDMDVQQFRQRCVEPMGEESDHLHIVALTDALQVLALLLCQSTFRSWQAEPYCGTKLAGRTSTWLSAADPVL